MNHVTIVLDASGSMSFCHRQMLDNVEEMLKAIDANARKTKQLTKVSLVSFDTTVKTIFNNVSSNRIAKWREKYKLGGCTALFDAVGTAIEDSPGGGSKLIFVFTDGYENASMRYNANRLVKLIQEKQNTGNWTFAFNVPPGHRNSLVGFGIPIGNIREWESSNIKSVQETGSVNVNAIGSYYRSRSLGLTAVNDLYTTDLSSLKKTTVKKELDNLSRDFTSLSVKREEEIRDLVDRETGNYVKGNSYYQLTKPEVVQETKDILVMEKGKPQVWGGPDARALIGIPDGRVKVVPGNHANYDIFVQSTSVNRKLVRGTKVLVKK